MNPVLVTIANGTEEMEAVIIIDILRRAGLDVIVAGETEIVQCSRKVKIIPDILINQIDENIQYAAIILPGGAQGTERLNDNDTLIRLLKKQKKSTHLIAAICAAPSILVRNGLIEKDIPITSHPSLTEHFIDYNYTDSKVVHAGNIITSRGAGTALDFTLRIVEKLVNIETAGKIAHDIIYKY